MYERNTYKYYLTHSHPESETVIDKITEILEKYEGGVDSLLSFLYELELFTKLKAVLAMEKAIDNLSDPRANKLLIGLRELRDQYVEELKEYVAKHNEIYVALDLALKSKKEQEG